MNLACPKCTSNEVRKLSMIYNEGLSIINAQTSTVGSGFGGGGAAFGSASSHTTGRQQTQLSKQASPPPKKPWLLWGFTAIIMGFAALSNLSHPGFGTLVCIGVAALAVRFTLRGRQYNAEVYPGLHQTWEESFMCNRCGEKFVPSHAVMGINPAISSRSA
ncbi:MAG: hypothetical protein ABI679_04030 [Gemmatimonadota bacterium]